MLIIGSVAATILSHLNTEFLVLPPKDLDMVMTIDDANIFIRRNKHLFIDIYTKGDNRYIIKRTNGEMIEIEVAYGDNSSTDKLLDLECLYGCPVNEIGNISVLRGLRFHKMVNFASLELLYTLKLSHRFLRNSPFFNKTRNDILYYESLGYSLEKLPRVLKDFLEVRERETYKYKHPNLNQPAKDFFNTQNFTYMYNHDDIHDAIKWYHQPAYLFFLEPGSEVKCSRELFELLPMEIKLAAVVEEACVLALERSLIPHGFHINNFKIFKYALEKVCTSITSGWFREFAWRNYDAAISLYLFRNENARISLEDSEHFYVKLFHIANEKGKIRKHES